MASVSTSRSLTRSPGSSRTSSHPDEGPLDGFAAFCASLTLENGDPFVLHPFQRRMMADYFDGVTETLILVSKKNGKTTLLAALALHHLLVTRDAECVIAAASRDQAQILLNQARGFVRRSGLGKYLSVKQREIVNLKDEGRCRVMASDSETADGVIPTLAIVDELHRHKDNGAMYGVFHDGLLPRGGQIITISTAGDDEDSALGRLRLAGHKLGGERDGAYRYARSKNFAMHEWALDDAEDRTDIDLVKQANPAPWQTVEALRERFESPSMTSWRWARFACGVWVRGEGSAIQPHEWDALEGLAAIPVDAPIYIGWDQGWVRDTTALVPLWWESSGRRVIGEPVILEPPGDGTMLDERVVVRSLLALAAGRREVTVVYDPNAGAQQMVQQLERGEHPSQKGLGCDLRFVTFVQDNAPLARADSRLMESIRRKDLVHNGDRKLRAHVLNAVEKPLGGERFKFDRPRRGARVPIDALRALSIAHDVAAAEAEAPARGSAMAFI